MRLVTAADDEERRRRARRIAADAVTDRMERMGLSQQELATRSGVSTSTIRKLQHAQPVAQRRKLIALADTLRWPSDAILVMLSGGDPPGPDVFIPSPAAQDAVWAKHERVVGDLMPQGPGELEARIRRLETAVQELRDLIRGNSAGRPGPPEPGR